MSIMDFINPVAFEVFGWPIRWYALFITSAMVVALIASSCEAKRRGISTDLVLEFFMWCIPLAVVFARIVYVVAHPDNYFPINSSEDFYELFAVYHGGITIIGAIFGGILGAFIVSKIRKINLLEIMDFGLPFMLLGQALGRWGNYANQEIYGSVVSSEFFQRFPLGVFINNTNSWHYATFFYEMVLNLLGFAILYILSRRSNKRGALAIGYFICYGIARGLMEFLREDATIFGGVYVLQIFCFVFAGVGIILEILIKKDIINFGYSKHLLNDRIIDNVEMDMELVRKELDSPKNEAENIIVTNKIIKDKKNTKAKP